MTKKVKSTGRFGARYGKKVRSRVAKIEAIQKQLQKCPYCHNKTVKRVAAGIWKCRKCEAKFANKAYKVELKKNG